MFWRCAWLVNVKKNGYQKFVTCVHGVIDDVSQNDPLDRRALNQMRLSSSCQVCFARELNTLHEQQKVKKKRQIIPEKIRKSVAVRAWKYGIPAARK